MTPATLDELLSPAGRAALDAAGALAPTEARYPACYDRLRKRFAADLARAALDTVMLRERARVKFARADAMVFDREGLEMASGEVVARHRAGRFAAFPRVADLGCGIGGDAIGLSLAGRGVVAVDRDPVRLRMAAANVAVYGGGGRFVCGDVLTEPLSDADAAFADPGRRPGGKRVLALDKYEPPVSRLVERFPNGFPLGVKVAPGLDRNELKRFDADAEFLSVGGELKECVLWFGPLRSGSTRATVLPGPLWSGHSVTGHEPRVSSGEAGIYSPQLSSGHGVTGPHKTDHSVTGPQVGPAHILEGDPALTFPVTAIGEYLYDPDPAVVRADLVGVLAARLGVSRIDPVVAFLTSDRVIPTPFATVYRVEEALPFSAKRVGEWLRARGVGRVTIVKRGSAADADELMRRWKLRGDGHRTVILTRAGGQPIAVIGERIETPGERGT